MNVTEVHIFGSSVIIFLQQEAWACSSVAAVSTAFVHGEKWQQVLGRESDHVNPRNTEFELQITLLPVRYQSAATGCGEQSLFRNIRSLQQS